MTPVRRVGAPELEARLEGFAAILVDAVQSGASVSFMLPFGSVEAERYWRNLMPDVFHERTLLLACVEDGFVGGTVQLAPAWQPNQQHRADIAKLLVHRARRRRGLGRLLMQAAEAEASRLGRTLLTLDTVPGSAAERLYLSLGYRRAGIIPGYARMPEGPLAATAVFYKQLTPS